jgi:hypothetical protein
MLFIGNTNPFFFRKTPKTVFLIFFENHEKRQLVPCLFLCRIHCGDFPFFRKGTALLDENLKQTPAFFPKRWQKSLFPGMLFCRLSACPKTMPKYLTKKATFFKKAPKKRPIFHLKKPKG